jgi:hypothetical protein
MSDEQKTTPSVPVRKVNVTSKKEESSTVVHADTSSVDKARTADKRAEILARAREAKRLKKMQKKNVTVVDTPSSESVVVDSRMDDHDTDSDDSGTDAVHIPINVPLSTRKRKAVSAAISRRFDEEDEPEERPRKKSKISSPAPDDGTFRTFLLDKVLDLTKLAAASGVASVGFVILKGIAGGQLTPNNQKTVAGYSSEWIKQ